MFSGGYMAKTKKNKVSKMDGLGPYEIKRIRQALRKVWHQSHARALVVKRCIGRGGFSYCEKCGKRSPKVFIDHTVACGDVDGGFIERLFTPSKNLTGMCKVCHQKKTNAERKIKPVNKKCIVENCDRQKGYGRKFHCEAHYYRLRRNNSVGEKPIGKKEKTGLKKNFNAEYRAWGQMWYRTTNMNCPRFKYYGGRGISVCNEWKSFKKFLEDMGPRPSLKHSLDRMNNEGNYEKSNCRWATSKEQNNNRSNSVKKLDTMKEILGDLI